MVHSESCDGERDSYSERDSSGGTHEFVGWLAQRGQWLSYSVGMVVTEQIHQAALKGSTLAWTGGDRTGR
ncbi:hypothetical protein KK483_34565 [Streptomyces sp. FIT100]|nr:hypothetical protein KK483_34565 [Streptomyces sp. FIT100]